VEPTVVRPALDELVAIDQEEPEGTDVCDGEGKGPREGVGRCRALDQCWNHGASRSSRRPSSVLRIGIQDGEHEAGIVDGDPRAPALWIDGHDRAT
jgi:hypothetical protein